MKLALPYMKNFDEMVHNFVADDAVILTIVNKNANDARGDESWEELLIKFVQDRPALYNITIPVAAKKKINIYKPSGSASQPAPEPVFRFYKILRRYIGYKTYRQFCCSADDFSYSFNVQ
ncbi:uncharacterized protein LOC116182346 [Photinus pyralis]|uniref:uncharacterized protein LOC116166002 n=1 Tax=Photinus pyralis TaxID=7054 RepID=UPI00126769BD|nr:uncharacterized protein LOC116166002 [Photinus pyralis]XP_031358736.1 uncharacterized protein LOC116182346 [Photinus pyralis]